MSEPGDTVIDRVKVREVTGVFRTREALDNAVSDLLLGGFDRASSDIKAAAHLRNLITKIEVHPLESKGAARLKITGDMSAIVGLTGGCKKTAVQAVAEEGIEPPTHGL